MFGASKKCTRKNSRAIRHAPPTNGIRRSVNHRTSMEVPSDDSTDRTIRQLSINWRNIAPTLKSHAMTQQAADILKTLHETTTIQPKQCSHMQKFQTRAQRRHQTCSVNGISRSVSHLTDMTLPYDDSTDRASPTFISETATKQQKQF